MRGDFQQRIYKALAEYEASFTVSSDNADQANISILQFVKFAQISKSRLYGKHPRLVAHISKVLDGIRKSRQLSPKGQSLFTPPRNKTLQKRELHKESLSKLASQNITAMIMELRGNHDRTVLIIKIQELRSQILRLEEIIERQNALLGMMEQSDQV